MTFLPVPPNLVATFDAPWNHVRHVNRCATMVFGALTVRLPSPDVKWLVYGSPDTATSAHTEGANLVVVGDPHFSGRICYGYTPT